MHRTAATVVALVVVAGLLWTGGELHRANCFNAGHDQCSVLPWKAGEGSLVREVTVDGGNIDVEGKVQIAEDPFGGGFGP